MSKKKLIDWVDKSELSFADISNPEILNETQRMQYDAHTLNRVIIDKAAIHEMLNSLTFPLQFFDYEGYSSAIPVFDGFGAYEQVPFQYSLHVLHQDGTIDHKEFLITEPSGDITLPLIERMKKDIDPSGTIISWYKSYESQRNQKLAELHPEHAPFLEGLNERMFDLMTIFSNNLYVDPAFRGSSSIKKVLPVIVPSLSYKNLNIHEGSQASERWEKLISYRTPQVEKDKIANDLLEYCKLDTWAMVEIYRFLKAI